jgi:tetratricopeptide (TPR) repeat protein
VAKRVEDLIEEADHLADDERFADAHAVLAKVLARKTLSKPQRVQALMSRASLHDEQGEHAKALADCKAALKLAPRSADILYLRSTIHQSADDWRASRADLDAAVAIDPRPDLYESRGIARYNLGDYRGAREDFAVSIAETEDADSRFHTLRGMAALLLDDYREAITDFTNALAHDKHDVKALAQRAKAYEATGDTKRALADLDRLAKLVEPSAFLEAERMRLRATSRSRRSRVR